MVRGGPILGVLPLDPHGPLLRLRVLHDVYDAVGRQQHQRRGHRLRLPRRQGGADRGLRQVPVRGQGARPQCAGQGTVALRGREVLHGVLKEVRITENAAILESMPA